MLEAKFIKNPNIKIEKKESWSNMKYNCREFPMHNDGGISCFEKKLKLEKSIKNAKVICTALGIFELYINGERVGSDELKPGWTDYRKRVFCYTYDVTNMLELGENVLLSEVSCGWWSCRISFGTYGFLPPAFCMSLEIAYTDGTKEIITTDETWRSAICGPVMYADIWDGEYYDARAERGGSEEWENAVISNDFTGEITAPVGPTCKVKGEMRPISATKYRGTIEDGTTFGHINTVQTAVGDGCEGMTLQKGENLLIDFGQNIVGHPKLCIRAKRGTRITVYFAELLNDSGEESRGNDNAKGSAYIKNYRSALSRIVYIASGNALEEYESLHTFFGYRYLEFETDGELEIVEVCGKIIGTDNRETLEFSCSNHDINKLYSNVLWGMRGNYLSIPTDCPQRDERLGWTGDTQIFCGAGSYMANIYDFMRKWLQDARDSQKDGAYPDVIPGCFAKERWFGNAAWGDAGIIVPYKMYVKYGDAQVLHEHYESMESYMKYLEQYGLEGANTAYGDWLSYEDTDKRYIAICYYAYDAEIMEKVSRIIGKTERAEYYSDLHGRIVDHFRNRYIINGALTEKSQTAYLLALGFSLLSDDMREKTTTLLREKIKGNGYKLSTGFVGTGILCKTLTQAGLPELAYSLLLQDADPSWLYSVKQGATTVWERWNSYTKQNGFGDVTMNSFNHYAYGAVVEWLVETMCGIMPDEEKPGFSHLIIAPKPDFRIELPCGQERMTFAAAKYDSASGTISSAWRFEGSSVVYEFTIPNGTSATVKLAARSNSLCVNGITLECNATNGKHLLQLGSGKYTVIEG